MIDLSVRRLAERDLDDVAMLEERARIEMADQRGGREHLRESPPVERWGTRVVDSPHPVWVALVDDVVVGYLELHLRDDRVAEVRQVYVQPEARELGLGDDLLASALEHAERAGCRALEASALPGDRTTKNLYERAGVVARLLVMHRALGERRDDA